MSILDIFIKPLEFVFEIIYSIASKFTSEPLLLILLLSICVNLLALPLYRRADIIQKSARDKEDEIRPMADHIRKNFKSDEKVMMLQIYYEQKRYHPLSSLKSIISLLLQIPFFIAAYQFLSHLPDLADKSIGPIESLSAPDGLLVIGGITINVLPILMTVVNIISSEIYMKGQPFRSKIVLYLSAAIFLVLLYNSPSGMVLYWLFNNLFSLVRNIIDQVIGHRAKKEAKDEKFEGTDLFGVALCFIFVLMSVLIPSSVIVASPTEFINRMIFDNPLRYVFYTAVIGLGMYIIWPSVYYLLMGGKMKKIFNYAILMVAVGAVLNYMVFGPVNRRLSPSVTLTEEYVPGALHIMINIVVLAAVSASVFFLYRKAPSIARWIVTAGLVTVIVMSGYNIYRIAVSVQEFKDSGVAELSLIDDGTDDGEKDSIITLSRNGRNVVVVMLDRAIGGMVPYIFEEKNGLYQSFDGFTYYHNTVSFGDHTKLGAPALFGGYEYTPEEMNKRSDELLVDKHNESLLVLPALFSSEGYHVSVIDPPFVNYSVVTDLTIFDGYENVYAYAVDGALNDSYEASANLQTETRNRNLIMYSIFRAAPVILQRFLYDNGNYHSMGIRYDSSTDLDVIVSPQIPYDMSNAMGVSQEFMDSYATLNEMRRITSISDDLEGSYTVMDNNAPHEPNILQEPEYIPAPRISNDDYDASHSSRFTLDGNNMTVDSYYSMALYHVNIASYLALGRWFDYLREEGVWDNTRIILVSDHGFDLGQFAELDNKDLDIDFEAYNALLMVKDFDSTGFTVSDKMMTNADVPWLCLSGIIEDPRNPFTGNPIDDSGKADGEVTIFRQYSYSDSLNSGTTFSPGRWYKIHNDIWNSSNIELVRED